LRWTMYTAAPPGNSRRFSPEIVREAQRRVLSTLWNTYSFFVTYANIAGFDPASPPEPEARTELDRWVRSELHQTVQRVTEALEDYEPLEGARPIAELIEQLSNWYVRRSRRRFWKSDDSADTQAALHTLYECLTTLSKLIAPFTPFLAEALYRNLEAGQRPDAPDSVHLAAWPEADADAIDEQLSRDVALVQRMVSLGRGARSRAGIKVRQPLASAVLIPRSAAELTALERLAPQVADELNVQRVEAVADAGERLVYSLRPNLPALGPRYGREVGRIREAIAGANPRELVSTMRAEGSLHLDGFDLSASDVLVDVEAAEGWSAAEDAGYSALVDTALTPELVAEGIARDVVRRLQDLRREAGLDITDRIHVRYAGGDELQAVLDGHGEYMAGETLALSLEPLEGDAPDGAASTDATIEGLESRFVLWRA
ncbi:MAG: class I tRNA ligase family protein, partial [Chloroflexi bacterium]|nr:class I tRNA ligase family protein [Chloroflexota bacterium]